jgi:hypothetical protein
MRLIVIINGYMEEYMLPDCLKSVRQCLPKAEIAFADGCYQAWVDAIKIYAAHKFEYGYDAIGNGVLAFTTPGSTDRTLEICKEYGVEHIISPPVVNGQPQPWATEYVKRNAFFSLGQPGDWYFWVDADERVNGTIDISALTEEAYTVTLKRDDNTLPYPVLRLFQHKEGIRCDVAHHYIWYGDRLLRRDDIPCLRGVLLYHEYYKRSKQIHMRQLAKGAYYKRLTEDEGIARAKYDQ